MKLTDTIIRNIKPSDKTQKHYDGHGLYLETQPYIKNGSKRWRFRYRFARKEQLISLGLYPEVSLKKAREGREWARRLLQDNVNPSLQRKIDKANLIERSDKTFKITGDKYFENYKAGWTKKYQEKVRGVLDRNLNPWLGFEPLDGIDSPRLLGVLRELEKEDKLDSAKFAKQLAGRVFRFGIGLGWARYNPADALKGQLKTPVVEHRAALTDPLDIGRLMLRTDAYQGSRVVHCSLKLAALTFVRPGELRSAEWSEIIWDKAQWHIPSHKMKMRRDHIVPLSTQALDVFREVQRFTGDGKFVFTNPRSKDRCMSENAVLTALRTMGYSKTEMCGHGYRTVASSLLNENLKELDLRPEWISMQLAHAKKQKSDKPYNRALYLKDRIIMMQKYADLLDRLREEALSKAMEIGEGDVS
jgi:integrase